MSFRIYEIFQGSPVEAADSTTILGTGSAGTPGAARRLVHPDSDNIPPLSYPLNPDRTFNLDNEVLRVPFSSTVLTLSDRKLVRFEGNLADAVVTEVWIADGVKASMPTFFFRLLYEFLANPPAFDPITPDFIQWEPRDRSGKVYNVQIIDLSVGQSPGGDVLQKFDVNDGIVPGGASDGGDTQHGLDAFDDAGGGVMDRTVFLQMKVVSEVT